MSDLAAARILVVHDWIVPWGGAERCLQEIMAVVPHADLIVGVRAPTIANLNAITRRARETWLSRIPFARTRHRWFVPIHYAAFRSIDTRGYDMVVSSSFSFAKAVRASDGRPHVCYCYSPPRYLWDMADTYRSQAGFVSRTALDLSAPLLRVLDRWSASGVGRFVAISQFVAERIRRAYDRPASVVYPPVAVKDFFEQKATERESFLLVVGRLVSYKRVDLAIAAARALGMRLVIAGDGPERGRLEAMGGPNVTFLGHVSEAAAADLLNRCRLFLFTAEDDFGIAPLEANAHGAPVVGFGRGGLTETMVAGSTAVLFAEQTTESLTAAITQALGTRWDSALLQANAARFSPARFREEIGRELIGALSGA